MPPSSAGLPLSPDAAREVVERRRDHGIVGEELVVALESRQRARSATERRKTP